MRPDTVIVDAIGMDNENMVRKAKDDGVLELIGEHLNPDSDAEWDLFLRKKAVAYISRTYLIGPEEADRCLVDAWRDAKQVADGTLTLAQVIQSVRKEVKNRRKIEWPEDIKPVAARRARLTISQ
jgi:hypothetical protein